MTRNIKLVINDGPDGASIEDIPSDIWFRFKERAKKNFPDQGDDAWASFLSEVILAVGGGTTEVASYFMTDVPLKNAIALEDTMAQANLTWDQFHAYLLQSATKPGHLRIIKFNNEGAQNYGTFIAAGIPTSAFGQIERVADSSVEDFMAAIFTAADQGVIKLEGEFPKRSG